MTVLRGGIANFPEISRFLGQNCHRIFSVVSGFFESGSYSVSLLIVHFPLDSVGSERVFALGPIPVEMPY